MNCFCVRKREVKPSDYTDNKHKRVVDMPRYHKIQKLAQTCNSTVYKAKCTTTGKIVALKKDIDEFECVEEFYGLYEVIVNRLMRHPNVVTLLEVYSTKSLNCYLVFEYLPTTLDQHRNSYGFDISTIPSLMNDLLTGISYCHDQGIVHLDLKPPNLLITDDGRLKIADFGAAIMIADIPSHTSREILGTLWYLAPELLMHDSLIGTPADIWAIGLIIVEMYKSKPLLRAQSYIDHLCLTYKQFGTPTEETWPGCTHLPFFQSTLKVKFPPKHLNDEPPYIPLACIDLLDHIFVYNPSHRYSANQCLTHHFFEKSGIKK